MRQIAGKDEVRGILASSLEELDNKYLQANQNRIALDALY